MNTKLDNGDIITTESIADKIRRVAKHPQVVENRRLLKAMHYITQRENAEMKLTQWETNVNGGSRHVTVIVASITVENRTGIWYETLPEKIVMFPLNSYDPVTNEPPTI